MSETPPEKKLAPLKIPRPSEEAAESDLITERDVAGETRAGRRSLLENGRHIQSLKETLRLVRGERDKLDKEVVSLRDVKEQHSTLCALVDSWRTPYVVFAVLMTVGGILIGVHSGENGSLIWLGAGWCALILSALFQIYAAATVRPKR